MVIFVNIGRAKQNSTTNLMHGSRLEDLKILLWGETKKIYPMIGKIMELTVGEENFSACPVFS